MIDGIPKSFQKKCKCCECFDWACICTFVGKPGSNKLECIANHRKKISKAKTFKQELEHLINIYKDEVRQNDYDIYKNKQQYVDKSVIVGCYKLIIKDLEKIKLLYEKQKENKLTRNDFEQWICDHTYNTYDEKNDRWLPDKILVLKDNTKYDKLEE